MRLVLLPGLDGTGRLFEPLLRALPRNVHASVIGYPASPSHGQNYEVLTEFAGERLGEGPLLLVGESFSGPIAVELAARHPAKVRGLVLAVSFLTPPVPSRLIKALAAVDHRYAPRTVVHGALMGRSGNAAIAAELEYTVKGLPPATVRARLNAVAVCNVRTRLADVACPILALQAAHDRLVPSRSLRRALAGRSGARICQLPGPHMLLQCNPTGAAQVIVAFMNTL